jgi:hypothetical protein
MPQGFLARVAGKTKQVFAILTSAGAADSGKIPALDGSGRLDASFMPLGIGAQTVQAPATEALSAGNFVNFWNDTGTFSVRLADNSNGRVAHGFVVDTVSSSATATVYPIDGVNAELSGLTIGSEYWLGTAGGVISTALDATDVANANKVCQHLGIAKSATELVTEDQGYVIL